MITENGGTKPLEAGASVVEHVKTVIALQTSGTELRQEQIGDGDRNTRDVGPAAPSGSRPWGAKHPPTESCQAGEIP
jgi:hypothetical protein